MEESSDESSVDEPIEPVSAKKRRGRDFKDSLEDAVSETSPNGGKKVVEKAKRAAKASGASHGKSGASKLLKSSVSASKESVLSVKKGGGASARKVGKVGKVSKVEASEESDGADTNDESEEGEVIEVSEEEEEEFDLSVEEEEVSVKWPPMPTKVEKGVSYYSWVEIDGVRVSRGDSVYLRSGETGRPYVGKLVELKRRVDSDKTQDDGATCTIDWWYRSGDVEGEVIEEKELIASSHRETNPILSIATSKRPNIIFGNDQKTKKQASQNADIFYYYRFFDTETLKVQIL